VQLIKGDSSEWINKEKLTTRKFNWQTGYGAFQLCKITNKQVSREYIENQQEHHRKINFLMNTGKCWMILLLNMMNYISSKRTRMIYCITLWATKIK